MSEYLIEAIIGSGKAWNVAREVGLYVYFNEDRGGHIVTDSGAHPVRVFPDSYSSESAAYRAIFAYVAARS